MTISNLEEQNSDRMRQRIAALRRIVSILDNRAAIIDGLVSALNGAEKRLVIVEAEVVDLKSLLGTANREISKFRATEKPVVKGARGGLKLALDKLL